MVLNFGQIAGTNSSFIDKEKSEENSFTAGIWGEDDLRIGADNILTLGEELIAGDSALEAAEISGADESKIVTKEFNITNKGELNVPKGFTANAVQVLKTINLSGDEKIIGALKDFEINLSDIQIEKEGEIDILVSDLKIAEGAAPVSVKGSDIVLAIIASEKPEEENSADVISTP
jgi:hypothetical protein